MGERLRRWLRPETFVAFALVSWVGAKVGGGLVGVERANPLLPLMAFSLVACLFLVKRGGHPAHHVGRAALLLWAHTLALAQTILFELTESASFPSGGSSWMAMATLGGASTIPLALLVAQRRDEGHSRRVALGVGLFLLLSLAGYNTYAPGRGALASTAEVAVQYADLGVLLIIHLSLASLVLMVEARALVTARAATALLLSQLLVALLGELASAEGASASLIETLASVAVGVGAIGVTIGLSMFVSGVLLAWFRREPMPAASMLVLIALLPIFAFTQGPYAPDRRIERMPFSEQNVPSWAPLRWSVEDETPDWLREHAIPRPVPPTVYVDAEGTVFVTNPRRTDYDYLDPRRSNDNFAPDTPLGAAWVSGETSAEALRSLAHWSGPQDEAGCYPSVDAHWLSPQAELSPRARARFPALALQSEQVLTRRIYFDGACPDDETYEIDADAAPPLRLLLQRQPGLALVVHGAEWNQPETHIVSPLPRPSPLALRESPWSIAAGLLLGLALAFVRMRRSRPLLGDAAPSSADAERRWPPWLDDDEATEKYFEASSDGSPYRNQSKAIASAPSGVVRRALARRLVHGLGWLFTFVVCGVIMGALFGYTLSD